MSDVEMNSPFSKEFKIANIQYNPPRQKVHPNNSPTKSNNPFKLPSTSTLATSQKKSSPFEIKVKKLLGEMVNFYTEQSKQKRKEQEITYKIYPESITKLSKYDLSIMKSYGGDYYNTSTELDVKKISNDFIARHNIDNLLRARLVDWMMEVFSSYNSEPLSFYLSVQILDQFFSYAPRPLCDNEIQLAVITSIYIASKMEDIYPLHMTHIVKNISHNKYVPSDIIDMEKRIMKALNFNIVKVTTFDFVRIFLFDFCLNNEKKIEELGLKKALVILERICVFLCKLLCLSSKFSKYKCALQAIGVITASFDVLTSNTKINKECDYFFRKWLAFLVKESEFDFSEIGELYKKIVEIYRECTDLASIAPTIFKLHDLKGMFVSKEVKPDVKNN